MKSIFEYMVSIFIMIILSLVFISFISIEMQIVGARNYHTRVIEMIQNDYDYENIDNDKYGNNFDFELMNDNTLKVTYIYDIKTPFFGTFEGHKLVGYAR